MDDNESIWDTLPEIIHDEIFSYLIDYIPMLMLVNKSMHQRFKDVDTKNDRSFVLKSQTLWNYAEQHFIRSNPKPPMQLFLAQTFGSIIKSDSMMGDFKPKIPLSLNVIKSFAYNGRVDLLDHYIENDDALLLTMNERLEKFPFDRFLFFQPMMEFVYRICFSQSDPLVLEWLIKHIEIFHHLGTVNQKYIQVSNENSIPDKLLFCFRCCKFNTCSNNSYSIRMIHQRFGADFLVKCDEIGIINVPETRVSVVVFAS